MDASENQEKQVTVAQAVAEWKEIHSNVVAIGELIRGLEDKRRSHMGELHLQGTTRGEQRVDWLLSQPWHTKAEDLLAAAKVQAMDESLVEKFTKEIAEAQQQLEIEKKAEAKALSELELLLREFVDEFKAGMKA
jgi:hypothetical protein